MEKKTDKPTAEDLQKKLTPEQYRVTQQCGHRAALPQRLLEQPKPGIYVDVVSGEAAVQFAGQVRLRLRLAQLHEARRGPMKVAENTDATHGMERTEVRSPNRRLASRPRLRRRPAPTGLRYCINSASLRFIPVGDLEKAGYGKYREMFVKAGVVKEGKK